MGVGFLWVVGRGERTSKLITPRRIIAVALLTLVAAVAALLAAQFYSHALWHLQFVVFFAAISLGIGRVRRAWPATGWTERSLVAVQALALAFEAGNAIAGGAVAFTSCRGSSSLTLTDCQSEEPLEFRSAIAVIHFIGESVAWLSLVILLLVCLVMLGVGVRGALRPAAQPS